MSEDHGTEGGASRLTPEDSPSGATDALKGAPSGAPSEPEGVGPALDETATLRRTCSELRHQLWDAEDRVRALQGKAAMVDAIGQTWVYRHLGRRLLKLYRKFRSLLRRLKGLVRRDRTYDDWMRLYDRPSHAEIARAKAEIARVDDPPTISVLMPVYNTPAKWLENAIGSVMAQWYPFWELCIADDASSAPHVAEILDRYARLDRRVKVIRNPENRHVSATTNAALSMATGSHVAFMDHDDELAPYGLFVVALELIAHPDAVLVYTDEDHLDDEGRRAAPHFKPDWNPDLLRSMNYVNHLCVVPREKLVSLGGLRSEHDGSQDYDLVLRITETADPTAIRHVPYIAYHWRATSGGEAARLSEGEEPHLQARQVLSEHLQRTGRVGTVEPARRGSDWHRVRYELRGEPPRVAVVMPTRDGKALRKAVEGVLFETDYPAIELVIVDNGSQSRETLSLLDLLKARSDVRVIRDDGPFNYSALNNAAVRQTDASLVCLMNDDIEVADPGWLTEMVAQIQQPGIGIVGAKLLYPGGTVQHAGVLLGIGGFAGNAHPGFHHSDLGYFGRASLVHDLSAVTAACMLVRREAFDAVGGLDERRLKVAFNDVDFCLRVGQAGWRIVFTPYAQLIHHESLSRGYDDELEERYQRFAGEAAALGERWGYLLRRDPAYNPNLTLEGADFRIGFPPRVPRPWELTVSSHLGHETLLDQSEEAGEPYEVEVG